MIDKLHYNSDVMMSSPTSPHRTCMKTSFALEMQHSCWISIVVNSVECHHHILHTHSPTPLLPQSSWSYVPNSSHLYCSNSSHSIMKCLMSFTSPPLHSTHLSSFTMSHIFLSPNSSALQNLTTCSQNCNFTQLYGPPSNSDTYISCPFSLYNHFKVHFFSNFHTCQFYELLSIPLFLPPSCCHFYPFIVIFLQTTYFSLQPSPLTSVLPDSLTSIHTAPSIRITSLPIFLLQCL